MSSKKQPYIIKTSAADATTSLPPRYQPPPPPQALPPAVNQPGILKHATLTSKDAKGYPSGAPSGKPLEVAAAKPPYVPDAAKFYPAPPQPAKPYPGYAYPGHARPPQEAARQSHRPEDALVRPGHRYPPDEDFHRLPQADMLKFVRKPEGEGPRAPAGDGRHVQGLVGELRALKEANQRLADDNQELRDLCCFLDDDRQKGRKLAREWQRFGRYTASVMRQEVSAYQSKLRELDNKQQELIKDNLELKELCLYLDEERAGAGACPACGHGAAGSLRDDGDGSSSSTNADEPGISAAQFSNAPRRSASRERLLHDNLARQRSTFNDQTMQYVRGLEQRVKQLEDEKRALQLKVSQLCPEGGGGVVGGQSGVEAEPALSGRPEAVVRALQVLEVREQLEARPPPPPHDERSDPPHMDDGEKALVREMCNVVWRKLEEGPQPRR